MKTLHVRNVCVALPAGVDLLIKHGVKEASRAGEVMVMPCPVVTITKRPNERVLFSTERNANPFFHLFEAIWMLAGRDDAASLNGFIKDFGKRFGEEDGTIHGAYGHRWRVAFGFDQLNFVVEKMKRDSITRQCVLQMWDSTYISDDLRGDWKDRPCNDLVLLANRKGRLDLSVICRSNDAIWGAHGANAVHFSILQEYLAARIGMLMGQMYQWSNNYHAYTNTLNLFGVDDRYVNGDIRAMSMFNKPGAIDADIAMFMEQYQARDFGRVKYANHWFDSVLTMAMHAHHLFKQGEIEKAIFLARQIEASDWRIACTEWLERIQSRRAAAKDEQGARLQQ